MKPHISISCNFDIINNSIKNIFVFIIIANHQSIVKYVIYVRFDNVGISCGIYSKDISVFRKNWLVFPTK